jgi:hypothetical protein
MNGRLLFDLPREQYDNLEAENWSVLKKMGQSPAHYLYAKKNREESDRDLLIRGSAGHVATLEPEKYGGHFADEMPLVPDGSLYAIWPKENQNRGSNAYKAFEVNCRQTNRIPLREVDHDWCMAIATAVRSSPAAQKYLEGPREVSMRWDHVEPAVGNLPAFTIPMKGRVDKVAMRGGKGFALVDMKSTVRADHDSFAKAASSKELRYDAQAALYQDGYFACTGLRLPFYWIAVEATPPHPVCVYRARDIELELGRRHYRDLLQRLHVCQQTEDFPPYARHEMDLMFPDWLLKAQAEALGDLIFADEEAA